MSGEQKFERLARAWLELGPTEAPEPAVAAALLTIETTPQERDLRILRRFRTMNTFTRLAVAAVVGVIAVGGAALYLGGRAGPSVGGEASPSPSLAPSPSPSWKGAAHSLQRGSEGSRRIRLRRLSSGRHWPVSICRHSSSVSGLRGSIAPVYSGPRSSSPVDYDR